MSDYDYGRWKPYVSVADRRRKAERVAAKSVKKGAALAPVGASRGAIAKTFWGRAWCDNLERYSDYANRLPRGRTYVRNGSVIDLQIGGGEVHAQVVGSSLYKVVVSVAAVPAAQWQDISAECAASIDSLVELLQGRLSKAVMERICRPGTGLFPAPREISLSCSCPDWAEMCKHVAAVLYGVGARLDQQPELLFRLRRVDANDLVAQAGATIPMAGQGPAAARVLDAAQLGDVFGIEIDEAPPRLAQKVAPGKSARSAKAGAPKRVGAEPKKLAAPAKVAAAAEGAAHAGPAKTAAPSKKPPSAKRAKRAKPAKAAKPSKVVKRKSHADKAAPGATRSSAAKSGKAASKAVKKPGPSQRN